MSAEKETFQRVQGGLFHLQKGLAPFVEARMKAAHGANWLHYASRASGATPNAPLDAYGLVKTMLDGWREVFDDAFGRNDKHKARNFTSMTLEARNAVSHLANDLQDDDALRYLDAMHQLLRLTRAPEKETAELKRLYDEQRRLGLTHGSGFPSKSNRSPEAPVAKSARETHEKRLLAYVREHPDLDDDELSQRLDIKPRQTVNQSARRLEAEGLLRRFRGPRGKIVNRAMGEGR